MKHQRRRARALALQALYEVDCVGHPAEGVIDRTLLENPGLKEDGAAFLRK
jgi:transcription termination factor NusB